MLMALISGQRRQTLHTLSIDRMQISSDKCLFFINSSLKTSRPGKHLACIEFLAYAPDVSICIVEHLQQYLKHTDTLRGNVKQLFISYSKPHKVVSLIQQADGLRLHWLMLELTLQSTVHTALDQHLHLQQKGTAYTSPQL